MRFFLLGKNKWAFLHETRNRYLNVFWITNLHVRQREEREREREREREIEGKGASRGSRRKLRTLREMSVSRVGVCIPSVPSPCSVARAVCSSSSSSSSSLVSRQRLVVSQATDGSDIMHGFQTVGAIATAGATLNKFGVLR